VQRKAGGPRGWTRTAMGSGPCERSPTTSRFQCTPPAVPPPPSGWTVHHEGGLPPVAATAVRKRPEPRICDGASCRRPARAALPRSQGAEAEAEPPWFSLVAVPWLKRAEAPEGGRGSVHVRNRMSRGTRRNPRGCSTRAPPPPPLERTPRIPKVPPQVPGRKGLRPPIKKKSALGGARSAICRGIGYRVPPAGRPRGPPARAKCPAGTGPLAHSASPRRLAPDTADVIMACIAIKREERRDFRKREERWALEGEAWTGRP